MTPTISGGTSLSEKDFAEHRVLFTEWTPRAEYAWDAGIAIGHYLAELKQGRIVGVRCNECHRVVVPPRAFCEWCFKPMDEYVPVADHGTVNTFSVTHVTWDMKRVDPPLMPAVIDLDGTHPAVGILHLLGEVDPQAIKVGMRVQAVWKPASEREGAITDIRYFKPE
jgi:uncharacterized OB-fold protein